MVEVRFAGLVIILEIGRGLQTEQNNMCLSQMQV